MGDRLDIRTLGRLNLFHNEEPVSGLASRKAEALLVYLAYTRQPVARATLADLLWDERSESQALGNLSVLLSSVRKSLPGFVTIARDGVCIASEALVSLDAHSLYQLETGDEDSTSAADLDAREVILDLYRGEFLQGFHPRQARGFEEWAALEREHLRLLVLEGLRRMVLDCLRLRQYRRGLRHARRWVELDPLSEAAHRSVMELYARQGEIALALAQYQKCRDRLLAELEVDPSLETTGLFHRLRSSAETRSNNLPVVRTPFLGRREALTQLAILLREPETRLISLVGPGGIGKTRLAIEAATRHQGDFLHGVCFVSLAGVEAPGRMVSAVAEALQFHFRPGPEAAAQLLAYLAQREILLLLDGFERLVEEATLVGDVLTAAPRARIIVTSRVHLRLVGEAVMEIGGLRFPEAGEAVEDAREAVDLFVQSATRVSPSFRSTPGTLPWILRICRRVDGLPLALEMAGAWLSSYTVQQVAEGLDRNLDFLDGALRDLPERQRSLRVLFEGTWDRLSREEQRRFRSLSVFPGTFGREAAEAIAGVSASALGSLVEKSLLHRGPGERHEAHEVLRDYASQKARDDPAGMEEVRQRFRTFFCGKLGRATVDLTGQGQPQALADLGQDTDNLRLAWSLACEAADWDSLDGAAEGLFVLLMIRGFYRDGADAFEMAGGRPEETTDRAIPVRLRARLLARAGAFHAELGHYDRAGAALEMSRSLHVWPGAEEELAFCLDRMGILARKRGDFAEARRCHEESLRLATGLSSPRALANSHNGVGNALYFLGDYLGAREHYEAALNVFEGLGDQQGAGRCLLNLANLADRLGDYPAARQLYERCRSLASATGDRWGMAAAVNNSGNVVLAQGDYREARRLYAESLAMKRELGHQEGIAASLDNLGRAAFRLGEVDEAKRLRESALSIRREISDSWGISNSLRGLGDIAVAQGDRPAAARLYREALEAALAARVPMLVESALVCWSELLWKEGEVERPARVIGGLLAQPSRDRLVHSRAERLWTEIRDCVPEGALQAVEARGGEGLDALAELLLARGGPPRPMTSGQQSVAQERPSAAPNGDGRRGAR